jgi:hypothetical protein
MCVTTTKTELTSAYRRTRQEIDHARRTVVASSGSLDSAVCITVTNAQCKDHESRIHWNCTYFNFKQSSARSSDPLGEKRW